MQYVNSETKDEHYIYPNGSDMCISTYTSRYHISWYFTYGAIISYLLVNHESSLLRNMSISMLHVLIDYR